MSNQLIDALRKLGNEMASGISPKGEACYDAGKLIQRLTRATLYVVPKDAEGGGTDYVIVYAMNAGNARDMVRDEFGLTDEQVGEVEDAVDVIDGQYDSMAILGTI